MDNSWIRMAGAALIVNILFDLIVNKAMTDSGIGITLIIILVALIYITIQLDKNNEKN